MRILFLTPHPHEGSSSRVRVYQFVPELEARGHVCCVRPFLSCRAFRRRKSRRSSSLEHVAHLMAGMMRRFRDILLATRSDIVFIHREALPYGPPLLERLLHFLGCKLLVDFDDALFLPQPGKSGGRFDRWIANPSRLGARLDLAVHAVAGNSYLADYARQHTAEVTVLPSVIDCRRYVPGHERGSGEPLVIGWMGSPSTVGYLRLVQHAISRLSQRYPVQLRVVGATIPGDWHFQALCKEFQLATEIQDLQSFDIGIMPLVDDEWARGKCAFKALQYMGVGIPVVSSPVGVIQDIIQDGQNGMLASSEDDWFRKLETLILHPELRRQLGDRGRGYVVKNFSVEAVLPRLLLILDNIMSTKTGVTQRSRNAGLLNSAQGASSGTGHKP
jgi:glycosyltransferase involved in cell wall biosynthesis